MFIPIESRQQWDAWIAANVRKPFRKHAAKAVRKAMQAGSSSDQIAAAAKQAEESRAGYMAISSLVLGLLSAAVAIAAGGASILAMLFTVASYFQGRYSKNYPWQALAGLVLAGVGLLIFAVRLAVR